MAMMDFGAIAFKNGKLISKSTFDNMQEMVGWTNTENNYYYIDNDPKLQRIALNVNDNYFTYVGDKKTTVCFYKATMDIYSQDFIDEPNAYTRESVMFGWEKFEHWCYWKDYALNIKVKKRNGYYVFKWKYNGDKYKVYFGYGVDFEFYKKTRRVNYYRSPEFFIQHIFCKIKYGY